MGDLCEMDEEGLVYVTDSFYYGTELDGYLKPADVTLKAVSFIS